MDKFLKYEDFINYLMSNKKLNAYKHDGVHLTINSIRDLEEAEKTIQK
jgi:NDP-sugar pyrophosphorylase family protein